jgi:hypothetical protein
MLADQPLPIGTLFKALSPEGRALLLERRLSLEAFVLRHPSQYSVFKNQGDSTIYVSRFGAAPETAAHGRHVAADQVVTQSAAAGAAGRDANMTNKIYAVLKYIPNEWCSYVALPIPDDIKRQIIRKPAKRFFESHPRYFEVRFDARFAHTFEVRRSMQLQEHMARQQQQQQQQ